MGPEDYEETQENPEIMTTRSGRAYQPSQTTTSNTKYRPRSATGPADLPLLANLFPEDSSESQSSAISPLPMMNLIQSEKAMLQPNKSCPMSKKK